MLAEKEGKDIAACLGDKKAALLQNHGLLTVGGTVEAAVFWFIVSSYPSVPFRQLKKQCSFRISHRVWRSAVKPNLWQMLQLADEVARL